MIDINTEQVEPLDEIKIIGDPAIATRWRWCLRGLRGGVKLETILIGNRRYTSKEAVTRFVQALNTPKDNPSKVVTQSQRERQTETSRRKLKAAGVL